MDTRENLTTAVELGIVRTRKIPVGAIEYISPPRLPKVTGGNSLANIFKAPHELTYTATYLTGYRIRATLAKIIYWRSGRKDKIKTFGYWTIVITPKQYFDLMVNHDKQVKHR